MYAFVAPFFSHAISKTSRTCPVVTYITHRQFYSRRITELAEALPRLIVNDRQYMLNIIIVRAPLAILKLGNRLPNLQFWQDGDRYISPLKLNEKLPASFLQEQKLVSLVHILDLY